MYLKVVGRVRLKSSQMVVEDEPEASGGDVLAPSEVVVESVHLS